MKKEFKFIEIFLIFFTKYIVLYIFLMFKSSDFRLIEISSLKDFNDTIVYLIFFMLPLPIFITLIFSTFFYYFLKIMPLILLIPFSILLVVGEYNIYIYPTSQQHFDIKGVYNALFSIFTIIIILLIRFFCWQSTNQTKVSK